MEDLFAANPRNLKLPATGAAFRFARPPGIQQLSGTNSQNEDFSVLSGISLLRVTGCMAICSNVGLSSMRRA